MANGWSQYVNVGTSSSGDYAMFACINDPGTTGTYYSDSWYRPVTFNLWIGFTTSKQKSSSNLDGSVTTSVTFNGSSYDITPNIKTGSTTTISGYACVNIVSVSSNISFSRSYNSGRTPTVSQSLSASYTKGSKGPSDFSGSGSVDISSAIYKITLSANSHGSLNKESYYQFPNETWYPSTSSSSYPYIYIYGTPNTGYTYSGLSTSSSGSVKSSFCLTSDTTIYAIWAARTTWTLSYSTSYGTKPSSTTVYSDDSESTRTISLPSPGTATGYIFNGWYSDSSYSSYVGTTGTSYTITKTTTLYAKWTSTDLSSYITTNSLGTVSCSNTGTYPWYLYSSTNNRLASGNAGVNSTTSTVTFTITLTSTATISLGYQVSSESNYDKGYISIDGTTVVNGVSGSTSGTYTSSALSTGSHTLSLWYTKDSSSYSGDDKFYVYSITLNKVVAYTVKAYNQGSLVVNTSVVSGNSVTIPASGSISGYKFKGWYIDSTNLSSSTSSFSYTPSADCEIYARWEKETGWSDYFEVARSTKYNQSGNANTNFWLAAYITDNTSSKESSKVGTGERYISYNLRFYRNRSQTGPASASDDTYKVGYSSSACSSNSETHSLQPGTEDTTSTSQFYGSYYVDYSKTYDYSSKITFSKDNITTLSDGNYYSYTSVPTYAYYKPVTSSGYAPATFSGTVNHTLYVRVYRVRCHSGNSSSSSIGQTYYLFTKDSITLDYVPTQSGYIFKGWTTTAEGTTVEYESGATISSTSSTAQEYELYPVFKNSSTITYNKNTTDTVGNMPSNGTKYVGSNYTVSYTVPYRSNYFFSYWSGSNSSTYNPGSSYTTDEDLTLNATWLSDSYLIDTHDYGTYSITNNSTYPWYMPTSGSIMASNTHTSYTSSSITITFTITSACQIALLYEINVGSNDVGTIKLDNTTVLSLTTSGQGTYRSPGLSVGTHTLYINYYNYSSGSSTYFAIPGLTLEPISTYKITYNLNLDTSSYTLSPSSIDSGTKTKGVPYTITSTVPISWTISGTPYGVYKYVFRYWNTQSDGSGITYNSGSSYTDDAYLTLYAIWGYRYRIYNNGSVTSGVLTPGESITLYNPGTTRAGYRFDGYYSASNMIVSSSDLPYTYTPTSSCDIYAKWTKLDGFDSFEPFADSDNYTIKVKISDLTGYSNSRKLRYYYRLYKSEIQRGFQSDVLDTYKIAGSSYDTYYTSKSQSINFQDSSWYNIDSETGEGWVNPVTNGSTTDPTASEQSNNPLYYDIQNTVTFPREVSKVIDGNNYSMSTCTVYTAFSPKTSSKFCPEEFVSYGEVYLGVRIYTITFDLNGHSGTVDSQYSFNYDEITLNEPSSNSFRGWAKSKDATTPDYPKGQTNIVIDKDNPKDVTLYAVWGGYTITFNLNGGEAVKTFDNLTFDTLTSTNDLPENVPYRDNYTFYGWSYLAEWCKKRVAYEEDAGGDEAPDGTTATLSSDTFTITDYVNATGGLLNDDNTLNLFAQWRVDEEPVTGTPLNLLTTATFTTKSGGKANCFKLGNKTIRTYLLSPSDSYIYVNTAIDSSDKNLKHDIVYLDDTYKSLTLGLTPSSFVLNNDENNKTKFGFIAQDVEEVFEKNNFNSENSAIIHYNIDELGNKIDYGLEYNNFIALNMNLIQSMYRKLDKLEEKLDEYENRRN